MSTVDDGVDLAPPSEMPWPPPGLEHIEGALSVPIRRGAVASMLLAVPVLWTLTSTESLAIGGGGLVFLVILAGLIFYLGVILRVAGVIDQSRRAMLLGYSRFLVAEVISDFDRRAGALALELEPYTSVPAEARNQARRLRVHSALLGVAAALVTPPMLALAVLLAVRGTTPLAMVFAISFGPALLLGGGAAAVGLWATTLLQWSRSASAWDPSPISIQDRADSWRARFAPDQRVRRPGLLMLVVASIGGILAFVFVLAMLSLPVLLALRGGSIGADITLYRPGGHAQRIDLMRPYRLPPDSTIDATRAGAALLDVARVGMRRQRGQPAPPAFAAQPWLAPVRGRPRMEHSLFVAAFTDSSPALRDSLQVTRDHPADSLVALVARAPAADIVGARFGTTAPDSVDYGDLALGRMALRELAEARAARAGFLAAEGRTAQAEHTLREVVSLAILLFDEGPTTVDALQGASIAAAAGQGLASLFEHSGREEEADALRRALSASYENGRIRRSLNARDVGGALRRAAADSTAPAFERWDALNTYTIQQRCRHPHAAVFDETPGPWLEELRPTLIRRPSDAIIFDLASAVPLEDLDRGLPRIARRAVTALIGPPSETNLCLWAGTFF